MTPGVDAEHRRDWLRLLSCGLDRHLLSTLTAGLASPGELFDFPDQRLQEQFGLSPAQCAALRRRPDPKVLDEQLRTMDREKITLLPAGHPDYPENLFKMRQPPAVLFVKGRLERHDTLAVGIVGPRNATPYGISVAQHFAREFAPTLTVVSGAAAGIDSAAHEAVLATGGRTIAVLGCGIDVNYPANNAQLRARIGSGEAGALVTIFPPGTQPHRHNFPIRNYVLAGLSLAVIIAEAAKRSGALVTARAAADEGRAVYAVPGDITRRNSEGSNQLLRDGASVCTKPSDIISDLEFTLREELLELLQRPSPTQPATTDSPSPAAPGPANPIERVLLDAIRHHPISHDDLIEQFVPARMTIGELSTALLMLEMNGAIEQQPGRVYAPRLS